MVAEQSRPSGACFQATIRHEAVVTDGLCVAEVTVEPAAAAAGRPGKRLRGSASRDLGTLRRGGGYVERSGTNTITMQATVAMNPAAMKHGATSVYTYRRDGDVLTLTQIQASTAVMMSFFLKPPVCVDQRFGTLGPLGTTLDASQVPRVDVRRVGIRRRTLGHAHS